MGINPSSEYLAATAPAPVEHFTVHDLGSADWAARKAAAIQRQIREYEAFAEAEVARIHAWLDTSTTGLQEDRDYFTGLLTAYHAQEFERNPKAKSIKLPHGVLVSRALPDKVEIVDEVTAIGAAKAAGYLSMVRVKEEISKTEVVKHLKQTGEVLPGVTVTPQPRRFSVELEEGE